MFPVVVELWGFPIHTYGVFLALGFASALAVAVTLGKEAGIPSESTGDVCLVALLSGLIGGRLLFVAVEWDQFADRIASVVFRRDGFVFYGGLLLAIPATIAFVKRRGLSVRRMADILAPALALGHSLGRLGCFAQGCCYGGPSDYGLAFPMESPASLQFGGVPVHPTQLYEAVGLLLLFGVLMGMRKRMRFEGALFLLYLGTYSLFRFLLEFLRADDRGFYVPAGEHMVSVSQIASLVILTGVLVAARRWRSSRAS